MSLDDPRIDELQRALSGRNPSDFPGQENPGEAPITGTVAKASVALVVRPADDDLELLVIRRATREGDPWSGHMAFPGGRSDPEDAGPQATAERETMEEVGIDLAGSGRLLGALDPVGPRAGPIPILISPFVFATGSDALVRRNEEVAAAFWVPIRTLKAPGAATEYLHVLAHGEELRFPAIAYQSHVIWGLTHRIMIDFLRFVPAPARE